ncbi:competence type IV pilus minor pilin ComGF [Virgibacillus ihumii]|uniref:competence type IV pilus minor pilin ComGF n=1 Tax=Virgibacillus ihumii TaxID=2686091 RepID=UPI00157E0D50|nr:competence type IV pilus minor pilin ComGF [Virgibacillus ihumii]
MLKTNSNDHVYMDTHPNEKGFTFISVLLMITVIFLTLPLIAFLTKSITYSTNYDAMSVQQFFYFLRDDVIASTDVIMVHSEAISLHHYNDSIVTFEKYNDLIRRQVDGQGHEIFLREVQEVNFKKVRNGVHVFLMTKQGEQYEKTIRFYH